MPIKSLTAEQARMLETHMAEYRISAKEECSAEVAIRVVADLTARAEKAESDLAFEKNQREIQTVRANMAEAERNTWKRSAEWAQAEATKLAGSAERACAIGERIKDHRDVLRDALRVVLRDTRAMQMELSAGKGDIFRAPAKWINETEADLNAALSSTPKSAVEVNETLRYACVTAELALVTYDEWRMCDTDRAACKLAYELVAAALKETTS